MISRCSCTTDKNKYLNIIIVLRQQNAKNALEAFCVVRDAKILKILNFSRKHTLFQESLKDNSFREH